jgi:hypothetical protein
MVEPLNSDDVDDPKTRMYTVLSEAVQSGAVPQPGERLNARLRGEDVPSTRNSQYAYYLGEMGNAALEYALSVGTDPDDFESIELDKALTVVEKLQLAFLGSGVTLKIWDNDARPFDKIKAGKVPQIDRSTVEAAVGAYLALPYRCRAMDRLLVRILIGMEFYTFGGEIKRHLISYYLGDIVVHAVFFGGIALLASWLSANGWISGTTAGWTAGICLSLFLLLTAINTVQLPFEWTKQAKARNTLMKMSGVYEELRTDGPISAKRVYERLSKTSEEGIVWPAPVFALLDDVISRTQWF